jgi:DNA-binding MarR family transcriptional regulator
MHSPKKQSIERKPPHTSARDQAENLSQTRREHASELAEDYVEAIADLVAEKGEARVVDLAARLGVTHVTVNRAIMRLQKSGFVTSQPYRAIFLTDEGHRLALRARVATKQWSSSCALSEFPNVLHRRTPRELSIMSATTP